MTVVFRNGSERLGVHANETVGETAQIDFHDFSELRPIAIHKSFHGRFCEEMAPVAKIVIVSHRACFSTDARSDWMESFKHGFALIQQQATAQVTSWFDPKDLLGGAGELGQFCSRVEGKFVQYVANQADRIVKRV